ncbi:hypothetical protein FQN57_004667 [Myotisia sp. PD_48]|nr:hypothetical protein FQN57_004667 [Myotisia sp. PD_48]
MPAQDADDHHLDRLDFHNQSQIPNSLDPNYNHTFDSTRPDISSSNTDPAAQCRFDHPCFHPHHPTNLRLQSYEDDAAIASQQQTSSYQQYPQSMSSPHLPLLPATTYCPPRASPQSLQQQLTTNTDDSTQACTTDRSSLCQDDDASSPGPHDFYFKYHDPFGGNDGPSPEVELLQPVAYSGASASFSHPEAATTASSSHSRASPPTQRQYRSPSPTLTSHPKARRTTGRSPATFSSTSRQRQTSLKDLVDKFNQTPNELGLTSSPSDPFIAPHETNRVEPSTSTGFYGGSGGVLRSPIDKSPSKQKYSANRHPSVTPTRDSQPSPRRPHSHSLEKEKFKPNRSSLKSPPCPPIFAHKPPVAVRRPLFGEVLPINTNLSPPPNPHIASARRRSGSDGCMHTPTPMLLDTPFDPTSSAWTPVSPTSWILSYTPSLAELNIPSPLSHRRSRSDLGLRSPIETADLNSFSMGAIADPNIQQPSPMASFASRRRFSNSQSRIPISLRRASQTSESGNSSPSTRANSALGRYPPLNTQLPPKGISLLPKPKSPRSPRHVGKYPVPATLNISASKPLASRRQPGRGHHIHQPQKSPTLKALITAPPPKQSPPLRSSKIRQPVSTASTSSSRAKVVDRISDIQCKETVRTSRTQKKPVELGNVDFAARRQKIQQAFNRTVEANAKKEERAAVRRHEAKKKSQSKTIIEQDNNTITRNEHQIPVKGEQGQGVPSNAEQEILEPVKPTAIASPDIGGEEHEAYVTPQEWRSPNLDSSTCDQVSSTYASTEAATSHIRPISALQLMTLQIPRPTSTCSDTVPMSAVTVETEVTTFDPEPQMEPPQPQESHRTMLNHIMQMRESSPSLSSTSEEHDLSSDHDDKESIHIMLRRSRFLRESMGNISDNQEDFSGLDNTCSVDGGYRWSMSSWNSSLQDQQVGDTSSRRGFSHTRDSSRRHSQVGCNPTFPPLSQPSDIGNFAGNKDTNRDLTANASSAHVSALSSVDRRLSLNMANHYSSIAKQARWDSKRATQLYLQELSKAGYDRPRVPILTPGSSESDADKVISCLDEESQDATGAAEDPIMASKLTDTPNSECVPHRASLILRDDWENASPSISDWMHLAATENEPQTKSSQQQQDDASTKATKSDEEGAETPRLSSGKANFHSIDSAVDGLGVAIYVQSPQDNDSPIIPPPLPNYTPPPPPTPSAPSQTIHLPPAAEASPSIYSSDPPSSVIPAVPNFLQDTGSTTRSSEESSFHNSRISPSSQTVASSITSQDLQNVSQDSIDEGVLPAARKSPTPEQRRLKKRQNIIKELVDTEYTFGRDMTVVVDIYKGTSCSCLGLNPDDIKTLFGNSEQIVQFSLDLQDALKQASKSVYVLPKSQRWPSKRGSRYTQASTMHDTTALRNGDEEDDLITTIGRAFVANIDRMEQTYSEYLRNHDAANRTLEMLLKNKNVNIWLKECRECAADLTTAWNLDSLLVKPVQRIVKYPLLLTELLNVTPPEHPDYPAIADALTATTSISVRINDMKKRADVVGQVVGARKRKESDVRTGLSKAFGRRTEKLKQHVGLSEMFTDKEYDLLAERFGENFFRSQLIMRDVELYLTEIQNSMTKFNDFVIAVESYITLAPSNYPELESKWCRFRLAVKDVMNIALVDHVALVRKSVVNPMVTLLKLHDGPQRVMHKRNKRLMDFVKYKAIKDRGDKPDKKITEQGEQFIALNVTLKEEIPKLLSLTKKLMETCLGNFVQIQATWHSLVQKRLGYTIERLPQEIGQIISDWSADFSFSEAQVLSLGICNGSILADTANYTGYSAPSINYGADAASSRRPSTVNSVTGRTFSGESIDSRKTSHDYGTRGLPPAEGFTNGSHAFANPESRGRANSSFSVTTNGHIPSLPSAVKTTSRSSITPGSTGPSTTNAFRSSDTSPKLPQLSLDTPRLPEFFSEHLLLNTSRPGAAPDPSEHPSSPDGARYSGFFSSAMPMPDSSSINSRLADNHNHNNVYMANANGQMLSTEPTILFLAASMFEFNIDRARREAGYPYLTYVAGEIFDVIGEKGDLWLARNQDDPTHQVGWIWTKHFAKLAG